MSHFDDETRVSPLDPAPGGPQGDDGRRWQGQVSAAWNIAPTERRKVTHWSRRM